MNGNNITQRFKINREPVWRIGEESPVCRPFTHHIRHRQLVVGMTIVAQDEQTVTRQPRRTVVVLLSTGEEMGLLGTRWYLERPVVPLDSW